MTEVTPRPGCVRSAQSQTRESTPRRGLRGRDVLSDLAARCLGSWIRLGDHAERDFGVDVSLPDTQSCPLTSGDACR